MATGRGHGEMEMGGGKRKEVGMGQRLVDTW